MSRLVKFIKVKRQHHFSSLRHLGYADVPRLSLHQNNKIEGRFILRAPSFIQNRTTLPPCDVGSRDQSYKQRGFWVRLGCARIKALYPAHFIGVDV